MSFERGGMKKDSRRALSKGNLFPISYLLFAICYWEARRCDQSNKPIHVLYLKLFHSYVVQFLSSEFHSCLVSSSSMFNQRNTQCMQGNRWYFWKSTHYSPHGSTRRWAILFHLWDSLITRRNFPRVTRQFSQNPLLSYLALFFSHLHWKID